LLLGTHPCYHVEYSSLLCAHLCLSAPIYVIEAMNESLLFEHCQRRYVHPQAQLSPPLCTTLGIDSFDLSHAITLLQALLHQPRITIDLPIGSGDDNSCKSTKSISVTTTVGDESKSILAKQPPQNNLNLSWLVNWFLCVNKLIDDVVLAPKWFQVTSNHSSQTV
jgi:hypothetical protein